MALIRLFERVITLAMDGQELQALSEMNSRIGRMEGAQEANTHAIREMASSVTRLVDKLDKSDDVAKEAAISARSAHLRLNGHDKIFFWAATTIIGSLIIGIIAFYVKGGGVP